MNNFRRALAALAAILTMLVPPAFAQSAASSFTYGTRYNTFGWVTGKISPDPDGPGPRAFAAVRNTYLNGRLVKVEEGELASWQSEAVAPASWAGFTIIRAIDFEYDAFDRKTKESVSASGTVYSVAQFSYDALDRLECSTARMNPAAFASLPDSACALGAAGSQGHDRITKNIYDAAGQLVQIRKAVGTTLEQAYASYSYTPNGKQEYVIDANGNRAKLEYDGFDRQVRWIFPSASSVGSINTSDYEEYGYDANGNRTSLRKRDGTTLIYQYDALNRNTVKSVPERSGLAATHTRDIHYSYDLRGLMTAARFDSPSGEGVTTAYDGFGRISLSTLAMDGTSRQLGSQYDANGNRIRLTFPDQSYVSYAYDGLDRPQSITGNAADSTRSYAYDATGALASDTAGSAATTTFGRDGIGRLTSLTRDIAGGSSLDNTTTLGYNPASQIVQDTRSNISYAYTGRTSFNRTYVPNGLNQYSSVSSNGYCYDLNGNLTADGIDVYLYDVENRLVEKRDQGSGNTNCSALSYGGELKATLRYDPMGRLYETVGASTTRYLIDGNALVGEYNTAGTMLRRYVHGADGKADDPIAWYEGSAMTNGALRHLYANHQGSIVLAADSTGSGAKLFRYDEYGIPQTQTGDLSPDNGARFLYTGQAFLPELGMYYYKARIYAPWLGRFMQTDPIGYDDQINLYAYVGNDPMNKTDPTGLESPSYSVYGRGPELQEMTPGRAAGMGVMLTAITAAIAPELLPLLALSEIGISDSASRGGAGGRSTEVVERAMSRAELRATRETGLLRGGRDGEHFVSDAVNRSAQRAQQRLALPVKPQVRVRMEVPTGRFSRPSTVQSANGMPGGGRERRATGEIPVNIRSVESLKK